ncbi:enoyl-CoA hydratase-related protein [Martelella soudanensis]|uniref:enoyl-CoA hydratase-related protein n=1 Tax=Martelella sp. NC20 TaxID=2740298 RepID=UPI00352FF488
MNRPDKLNAVTREMTLGLLETLDSADREDGIRAIVITGAGRAFCAGADLSGSAPFFDATDDRDCEFDPDADRDLGGVVTLRILECRKPVIAAINGAAVGFGATLVLPSDARFCSEESKFAYPFTRRGIVPDGAASWFLPRVVGMDTALDWCLSGRAISSEEALEKGLVLTRRLLWTQSMSNTPMSAHMEESRLLKTRSRSSDAREGVESFLQKRAPDFQDRVPEMHPDLMPSQS